MSAPQRFRKKPVEIEAMKWGLATLPTSATDVIGWILARGGTARYHETEAVLGEDGYSFAPEYIAIDTLEVTMKASPGDWIIRGVQGEFHPCKPDIFAETYEEIARIDARTPEPPRPVMTYAAGGIDEYVPVSTVHLSRGGGVTVCCKRTLFELPRDERVTNDPNSVTCEGPRA